MLVAATATLTGCELPQFGAPDPASEEGDRILELWQGSFLAALFVGLLVYGLVLWCILRYRRRDDEDIPGQRSEHIPLELVYTAVPVAIVAVLFLFTVQTQRDVVGTVDDPDLVVEVTGFQWQWRFTYPDLGVEVLGETVGDVPELVLPVGATVQFELETADVIHAFWVPEFLYKRDLIPNVDNAFSMTVTEAGTFDGKCAEFCGLDHYRMNFVVRAVPQAEFDDWVDEQLAEVDGADR